MKNSYNKGKKFENGVNLNGPKTRAENLQPGMWFENGVNLNGSKTSNPT